MDVGRERWINTKTPFLHLLSPWVEKSGFSTIGREKWPKGREIIAIGRPFYIIGRREW